MIQACHLVATRDLAKLYQCKNETKTINQSATRNLDRLPKDFYFKLTEEEYNSLKSQFRTLKNERGKHSKYLPYVFTEQGVAMLATVIRTKVASEMSISIMRAFVEMRKYISANLIEQKYINNMMLEDHKLIKQNSESIKLLQQSFKKFEEKKKNNEIYFNG